MSPHSPTETTSHSSRFATICRFPIGRVGVGLWVALSIGGISCFGSSGGSGDYCSGPHDELVPNSSDPRAFAVADEKLFFVAGRSARHYNRVWLLDGDRGPKRVADLVDAGVRATESGGIHLPAVFGDDFYFIGDDGNKLQLWRTDGTSSSLAIPDWPADGGTPVGLTPFGDFLYFVVESERRSEREFWRVNSDGVATFVADGPTGFGTNWLQPFQGRIVFGVGSGSNAGIWELYPDGELLQVSDVESDHPHVFDGKLYVQAEPWDGAGMWVYDGTNPLTRVGTGFVTNRITFADELYFVSYTYQPVTATLWAYDGANPPRVIRVDTTIDHLTVFENGLFFANSDGTWRADASSPPIQISDERQPISRGTLYDGKIYFAGGDDRGQEFWEFDGVRARFVVDLYPGEYCYEDD